MFTRGVLDCEVYHIWCDQEKENGAPISRHAIAQMSFKE